MEEPDERPLSSPPCLLGFEAYLNGRPDLAEGSRKRYLEVIKLFTKRDLALTIERASAFMSKHRSHVTKASLIHYARFLNRRDIITELKEIRLKIPEPKPREIPSYDEFMRVIEALPKEERFISLFLLHTGARCREAMMMTLENIENGRLKIPDVKGKKWRIIELPDAFHSELMMYLNEDKGILALEPLFYSHLKSSLNGKRKRFWKKLSNKSQKIIGKGIGTHDFRRFNGTYLYEKTRDIQLVNRMLGHTDIKTTMVYTKYVDKSIDLAKTKKILSELGTQQSKTETGPE